MVAFNRRESKVMGTTAIVTAGAGARGAYEAGILSVLVPRLLAEAAGEERIVLVGTSAGAVNTALLAESVDPMEAIDNTLQMWESLSASDIFAGLTRTAIRNIASYLAELLGRGQLHSLLDSAPLRRTAEKMINLDQLRDNLDGGKGWAHGAGIVTTSRTSGRTIVFLQGKGIAHPPPDDVRGIDYVPVAMAIPHILASAAIPMAFLPIHIDQPPAIDGWFVDGGVRLNAPIKPALALGADRVIVVATTPDPGTSQPAPVASREPDVFDAAGVVMQALLVDQMAEDVHALRKTNRFAEVAEAEAPAKAGAKPLARRDAGRKYRQVQNVYLGPPEAGIISGLANEIFERRYRGWFKRFSDMGVLGHLLGGPTESHGDLLSFLFFDPEFHSALIESGQQHAEQALGPGPGLPWRF
jgi:NTE family protein